MQWVTFCNALPLTLSVTDFEVYNYVHFELTTQNVITITLEPP